MLAHPRGTEIIAFAADCDDQRIVVKAAPRRDLMALLVDVRCQRDFAALPVEGGHLANAITKTMPVRLRQKMISCTAKTTQFVGKSDRERHRSQKPHLLRCVRCKRVASTFSDSCLHRSR